MSCIPATCCQCSFSITNTCPSRLVPPMQCSLPALKTCTVSLKLNSNSSIRVLKIGTSRYHCCTPVCLLGGGKDKLENGKEASPWKAIENAMGSFKKRQSIEDLLREQMEKQEFYDGGGSGRSRPSGGGGNSGDDFEDDGFSGILDETLQVVLATAGLIFLYIYIINGEEIKVLLVDLLKFLFRGQKSFRLRRLMYQWGRFFQRLKRKKEVDPYWLERAIITTPTWWDSPEKYKRIINSYLASKYDQQR